MKKRSIKTHILMPTLVVLAIGLGAQAWFLGNQSFDLANDMSRRVLDETANRYAAEFQAINAGAFGALEAYAPMLAKAGDEEGGRERALALMRGYVGNDPLVLGMWTAWKHNAFDGRDASYAGTNHHDSTGSFMPYVFRANGGLGAEPLSKHSRGDYMAAATTGENTIAEPYLVKLDGNERLLYSLSVPIIKGGEAVGVLGMDLDLQAISEAMDTNVLDKGYVFTISPSGLIATHPDKEMVMSRYASGSSEEYTGESGEALAANTLANMQGVSIAADKRMSISTALVSTGSGNWAICAVAPDSAMVAPAASYWLIVLCGCLALFAAVMGTMAVSAGSSLRDLRRLTVLAGAIANGKFLSVNIQANSPERVTYNEAELIRRSLATLANSMKRQFVAVKRMSMGDLDLDIHPRNADDAMNIALCNLAGKGHSILTEMTAKVRELNRDAGALNSDVADLAEQSRRGARLADSMEKAANADVSSPIQNPDETTQTTHHTGMEQMNNLLQTFEDICESTASIEEVASALDEMALQCKDVALNISEEAGRSGDEDRQRLGMLAVKAKDLFDLCNSLSAKAVKMAGERRESVELGELIAEDSIRVAADALQLANALETPARQGAGKQAGLAENLRRITRAVDAAQAEQAAKLAENLAFKAGELDGIICRFKMKPAQKKTGMKLELKKLRQGNDAALPAEQPAYKSAASAGL